MPRTERSDEQIRADLEHVNGKLRDGPLRDLAAEWRLVCDVAPLLGRALAAEARLAEVEKLCAAAERWGMWVSDGTATYRSVAVSVPVVYLRRVLGPVGDTQEAKP